MGVMNGWYNLEDRENYDFASYMVITETDKDRFLTMIFDYDEAIAFKNERENDKKYVSVSKVWKINKKTENLLSVGLRFNE